MRLLFVFVLFIILLVVCGGEFKEKFFFVKEFVECVDDGKGVGEIMQVMFNDLLNEEMVDWGKVIYEMKCFVCYKFID